MKTAKKLIIQQFISIEAKNLKVQIKTYDEYLMT